jgi:hypothetical protein
VTGITQQEEPLHWIHLGGGHTWKKRTQTDKGHSRPRVRQSAFLTLKGIIAYPSTTPLMLTPKFVVSEILDHLTGLCKWRSLNCLTVDSRVTGPRA